jgi:hypothetical protein
MAAGATSTPDFVAELAVWRDLVSDLVRTAQGLEDFTLLIRYIHHTADFAPGSRSSSPTGN